MGVRAWLQARSRNQNVTNQEKKIAGWTQLTQKS